MTETPDAGPARQQIEAQVAAVLDGDPALAARLAGLPAATVREVQRELHAAVPPEPAAAPTLFDGLAAHVRAELGVTDLTAEQTERLTLLATQSRGKTLETVIATSKSLSMILETGRKDATFRQDWERKQEARTAAPFLRKLAEQAADPRAYVAESNVMTSSARLPLLWTSGVGGCLGVAILRAGVGFLAHYTPGQLNPAYDPLTPDVPSALDKSVTGILERFRSTTLNGATFWFSSPSVTSDYVTGLQQRLVAAGAQEGGRYTSDRLALRVTDGTVHPQFRLGKIKAG